MTTEGRIRWPDGLLESYELPVTTKQFLYDVGLPQVEDSSQRFGVFPPDSDGNLVIGDEYGNPVYVQKRTGKVFAIQPITGSDGVTTARRRTLFVNSTVALLAEFVELFEGFRADPMVETDSDHAERAFRELERRMREKDPRAFSPGEEQVESTLWQLVLDDVRWQL